MNATRPLTDPWVVFDYEVEQFEAMCGLLEDGNIEYAALLRNVQNAVVESALLHTRIITDILLSRGKQPDDINISELLPGFIPNNLAKLKSYYGDSRQENSPCWTVNKKLAHATTCRSNSYDYSSILIAIYPLVSSIIDEIKQQRN